MHQQGDYIIGEHIHCSGYLPSVGCAVGMVLVEFMIQDMMPGLQRFSTALLCEAVMESWMKRARQTALQRDEGVSEQHLSLTENKTRL